MLKHNFSMNRLSRSRRVQILSMLCEGSSMRSVSRVCDVSINTVSKLLIDAGRACAAFHDEHVRNVRARRVQVDEIWSFTYAKQKNVEKAKAAPEGAGDTWTWTAIDADSKLIISWLVGPRDAGSAFTFVSDLAGRLANRTQLTSDGLSLYVPAIEDGFGANVDYSQLVKIYGSPAESAARRYSPATCLGCVPKPITGEPDPKHISTSCVERSNLTMRMSMRRYTRLTNGFPKKLQNHVLMVALYTVWYNWARQHKTLRTSPAQAAGLTDRLWNMSDIVALVEAAEQPEPMAQAN